MKKNNKTQYYFYMLFVFCMTNCLRFSLRNFFLFMLIALKNMIFSLTNNNKLMSRYDKYKKFNLKSLVNQ